MHEEFDDDEEYNEDDFNYDHPSLNPYKWYFKFDIDPGSPISSWINDIINNMNILGNQSIPNWPTQKFPVNSWFPNTGSDKLQYLGSNYQGSQIWKKQYFIIDKINTEYKLHLQSHAAHFIKQPIYYKGMFDILN